MRRLIAFRTVRPREPRRRYPVVLFDLDATTSSGELAIYAVGNSVGVEYDVLPDGRFVMIRQPDQRTTREIVLLRNWLGERQRRVPTK